MPYAYEHSAPGSALREHAVDLLVFTLNYTSDISEEDKQSYPSEMLHDMLTVFSNTIVTETFRCPKDEVPAILAGKELKRITEHFVAGPFFCGNTFTCSRTVRSYFVSKN